MVFRFLAARVGQAVFVAFVVTSVAFLAIHLAPGDPLAIGPGDPPELAEARAAMRHAYGLDRPLWVQYPAMLGSLARGDFGVSYTHARPVLAVMRDVIPRTLLLMAPALLFGIVGGIALGTWQGVRAGRMSDRIASVLTLGIISFPEFLLGLVLSTVFALRLGWFPATGMRDARATGGPWIAALPDVAWHATLPLATLVIVIASAVARYQRAAVAEAMAEEFVRAARARGASMRDIVFRHVLRRTAPAILTVIGLLLPLLVSGAALVEVVFNWPGAGSALLGAVNGRDYPLVIGLVVVGSVAVSAGTALADLAAIAANPAQRHHA